MWHLGKYNAPKDGQGTLKRRQNMFSEFSKWKFNNMSKENGFIENCILGLILVYTNWKI